jgi:hypothetical protein
MQIPPLVGLFWSRIVAWPEPLAKRVCYGLRMPCPGVKIVRQKISVSSPQAPAVEFLSGITIVVAGIDL